MKNASKKVVHLEERRITSPKLAEHQVFLLEKSKPMDWIVPEFQREFVLSAGVAKIAAQIEVDEMIPGQIILGRLVSDPPGRLYIIDGRQRLGAFDISSATMATVDATIETHESLESMSRSFVTHNRHIRNVRPDDLIRAIEQRNSAIRSIRQQCPFVGYTARKRDSDSVIGFSMVLRAWHSSQCEVPSGSVPAYRLAEEMQQKSAEELILFMQTANLAWGRKTEARALWANLNLTLCMWLWNRCVLHRPPPPPTAAMQAARFRRCLEALRRHQEYCEWLAGKNNTNDHFRAPAYQKITEIFVLAARADGAPVDPKFPTPAWSVM